MLDKYLHGLIERRAWEAFEPIPVREGRIVSRYVGKDAANFAP